jgi:AmpE protein
LSYLIFIVAAGLFALLGAGGPLHRDNWFDALSRRVDAVELDLWPSLFLRVAAPLIGAGIVLLLLAVFLGELADALMGLALLYFAWGRGDYSTDLARFVARARVGDKEGADMLLTDNAPLNHSGEDEARRALRDFAYRGFSRWFPPVLYFWLLGPFAAAAYRLVELANSRCDGQFDAALRLLDWLPARLLLLTFSVLGDFERTRGALTSEAFDQSISEAELLAQGIERAWHLDGDVPPSPESVVTAVETTQKAITRATVAWLVVVSLLALL